LSRISLMEHVVKVKPTLKSRIGCAPSIQRQATSVF
jgi:hypothetical protein